MKIGIDCRDLVGGSHTGTGRFVSNVIRCLPLTADPPALYLYGNQHTVFELPAHVRARTRRKYEGAAWWWDRITLPRMVRRDKLDVFLSPTYKAPGIRSCPVAITIHDLLLLRMPPELSGRGAMYVRAFRPLAASSAARSTAVLTVSEHSRTDIIELLGVRREKTHVVGHCVSPEFRPVDDAARLEAARSAYGIEGDYVLYVGSFGPHKNVDGLLRAFAALPGELRRRVHLVLVGQPAKRETDVHDDIHRLDIPDRVQVTGHVSDEHLPALFSGASAFVTLSRWEGFGLPVLEAMACGTPVVCSNRAALPEVAGDATLMVDPEDANACAAALARILTDDELRRTLTAKGRAQAAVFPPERFARLVIEALTTAANAR